MNTTLKLALQLIEVMKYRIEHNELLSGFNTLYMEVMKEYDRAKIDGRDTEALTPSPTAYCGSRKSKRRNNEQGESLYGGNAWHYEALLRSP